MSGVESSQNNLYLQIIGAIITVAGFAWGMLWAVKTGLLEARSKRRDVLHEIMIKSDKNIDLLLAKKILRKEGGYQPKDVTELFQLIDKIGYLYFSKTIKRGELIYFFPLLELLRENKVNSGAIAEEQGLYYAKYLIDTYVEEYKKNESIRRKYLKIFKRFGLQNLRSILLGEPKKR